MNANQIDILKTQMLKIDDDRVMTVMFVYHTKKGNDVPSFYRYLVNIDSIDNIKNTITEYMDPSATGFFSLPTCENFEIPLYHTKQEAAAFLKTKLNKIRDWDTGIKILNGFKPAKNSINENAKYQLNGYLNVSDNSLVDIDNIDSVRAIKNGTWLKYDVAMKRAAK